MPVAVKIKTDKYGEAILLLVKMSGVFQTRYQDTLIVNAEQKRALEEAGYIEENEARTKAGKHGDNKTTK